MAGWNPWHGCRKKSEGCLNCYVYRGDDRRGRDASVIARTQDYDLPVRRGRGGAYKIPSGETVYTCFTSDFFLEEADEWRTGAWDMMRERSDLNFFFVTKRIERFFESLPDDWGDGWDNVAISCTCENQRRADERLPIFRALPIKHKHLAIEPMLERMELSPQLGDWLESVMLGGESGPNARVCDFDWVLDIRRQCDDAGVSFSYHQTGARLIKDGRLYNIPRREQHSQAHRAGIDT
ncbi:MAG: DUF5131 family protein [Oscillospiraceae bacterium]|nr:DUF5131 family protein [Oscillospiraceae bacterium]